MYQDKSLSPTHFTMDYTSFLRKRRNSLLDAFLGIEQVQGDHPGHGAIKKPRLHYSKTVRIAETEPLLCYHEYTKKDLENSWYSKSDYENFLDDCRSVLRKAEQEVNRQQRTQTTLEKSYTNVKNLNNINKGDTTCTRGLEDHIIPELNKLKQNRKRGLQEMVLRQQAIHRLMGSFDVGRIRSISVLFSTQSNEWATELAALDEAFVRGNQR
jgi:hypothetical protein